MANNRQPIGGGEYIPSAETNRKTPSSETPELRPLIEGNEKLAGIERIVEEPDNEHKLDEDADLEYYQDLNPNNDAYQEKSHIVSMLKKYPKSQRTIVDQSDGIDCIYLGSDQISRELLGSIQKAKSKMKAKIGAQFGRVFQGLKIYYVRGEIASAGWTYSGANAILMDIDKNSLTINQAEILLGQFGLKILDEGDWLRVVENTETGGTTLCGETTLVHEFGHMLQAKSGTKIPDTENSPTKYGRSKEWEDYAESFLYFCYDKSLLGNRAQLITYDIQTVTQRTS